VVISAQSEQEKQMNSPRFLVIATLSYCFTFSCPVLVRAQENSSSISSNETKLKPIEIQYYTLGGLQYSIDGRFLINYQDFRELISPLRDYETERLLRRSESSDFKSKVFGIAGFAGVVTGVVGLLTSSSNRQVPFWITAVSGAILFDIGSLFQSEAQTSKFNCVQRYNRFARNEEQILPKGPIDEKLLLKFDSTNSLANPKGEITPNE
jgi:hypothetical protein